MNSPLLKAFVAGAVIGVPAAAPAVSTAFFDGDASYSVFISAPGATVEPVDSSTPEGASTTGTGVIDSFDSPLTLSPVAGSADAAGSVPGPNGSVALLADSGISTRVTAGESPVTVIIDYILSASTDAGITTDPGDFSDAFVTALAGIDVLSSSDATLFSDSASAATDAIIGPFGPDADLAEADALTFLLGAGDFLVIESFATVDGFAEVVREVPLPAGFALLLTGLAGLGALARRGS